MRILEETQAEEYIITCQCCHTKFAYSDDDIFQGIDGTIVECPKCHELIIHEKYEKMAPFPKSYYSFINGVDIKDSEIEGYVRQGLRWLINHPEEYHWVTGTGNTMINITWYEDDDIYSVQVAKGYYNKDFSSAEAKRYINYKAQ